jgi:hypothetical protein
MTLLPSIAGQFVVEVVAVPLVSGFPQRFPRDSLSQAIMPQTHLGHRTTDPFGSGNQATSPLAHGARDTLI